MNLSKALKTLGIEEYESRIFRSNSRGELFHLMDYFLLAEGIGETDWFADWFRWAVKFAEDNWSRPESIFQHIPKALHLSMKNSA